MSRTVWGEVNVAAVPFRVGLAMSMALQSAQKREGIEQGHTANPYINLGYYDMRRECMV